VGPGVIFFGHTFAFMTSPVGSLAFCRAVSDLLASAASLIQFLGMLLDDGGTFFVATHLTRLQKVGEFFEGRLHKGSPDFALFPVVLSNVVDTEWPAAFSASLKSGRTFTLGTFTCLVIAYSRKFTHDLGPSDVSANSSLVLRMVHNQTVGSTQEVVLKRSGWVVGWFLALQNVVIGEVLEIIADLIQEPFATLEVCYFAICLALNTLVLAIVAMFLLLLHVIRYSINKN
jgi:hypothetical protein